MSLPQRVASGLAAAVLAVLVAATPAAAQERRSWEIAAGAVWFSGAELGGSAATLERPGGGEFVLFRTDTSLEGAIGPAVALSFFATRRLAIEAGFSYARPGVSTRVTGDAEDAPPVTATIGLQQYTIEAGARWYFTRRLAGARPFVRAGGGYLRQLDEHSALVETGRIFHAGAGLERAFVDRPGARISRIGLRLDARAVGRSGGIGIDDTGRLGGAASAYLFFGF